MREWLNWHLWRKWTPRVELAFDRCRWDKGYVSVGDYEQIRYEDPRPGYQHWALQTARFYKDRR